jgi:hypothetical protein
MDRTPAMKAPTSLLLLLAIPVCARAQQDSTEAHRHTHSLEIAAGSKGAGVRIVNDDTIAHDQGDTLRITTRHKLIRIITTLRTDRDSAEAFADRLTELRQERRRLFTYWAGVDLGINTFVTSDGRVGDGPESGPLQLNNARSRFLAINFYEHKFEFGSHHAGLYTGLGVEFDSYKLSENVSLQYNGDSTWAIPVESPEFRKNKLRQIGLRVPLMFEFNTKRAPLPAATEDLAGQGKVPVFNRKGNFHIAAGLIGSWYFDTMYKQRYEEGGELKKFRMKADYNLLPYRVAASVRLGYGALNLFAEYALTPMFQEGTAPALSPLNVGLTLVGFN